MALSRFVLPFADVGGGIRPSSGAKLFFFATGTSTPASTFSDSAGGTANTNPVISDANGVFPDIFLSGTFNVVLKDKNDVQIWSADPVTEFLIINDTFQGVSAASAAISAAPSNYPVKSGVKTLSYRTKAECDALSISYPDGGGADYVIVASGTGTPDGGEYIDIDAVVQIKLINNGVLNSKVYGVVSNGIVDDTIQIQRLMDSPFLAISFPVEVETLITSTVTCTNKNGMFIKGGNFKVTSMFQPFEFTNCDNLEFNNAQGTGYLDRAGWEALTPEERALQISFFLFTSCYKIKVLRPYITQWPGAVKFDLTTYSVIEDLVHVGVFGVISAGVVINPNLGYSIFIRGGNDISIRNPVGVESGGVVLVGLTAPRVSSFGGTGKNCHDNGWYGSSLEDSICEGFSIVSGLQTGVKMRGSRNIISNCSAVSVATIAFNHTGIPLDSFIDSQGAVGSGSSIRGCVAHSCKGLASIRFTTDGAASGNRLLMRDCSISDCIGTDIFDTGSVYPIELYGVKNVTAVNNIVNGFSQAYAILVESDDVGGICYDAEVTGNIIENGPGMIIAQNCERLVFEQNKMLDLDSLIISSLVNVNNSFFSGNKSDVPGKRLDIRGLLGNTCLNNNFFIQGNNTIQGQSYSQGNKTNPNYDITTLIPTQIGHIVSSGTAMYIAKGTASTADWVAL